MEFQISRLNNSINPDDWISIFMVIRFSINPEIQITLSFRFYQTKPVKKTKKCLILIKLPKLNFVEHFFNVVCRWIE